MSGNDNSIEGLNAQQNDLYQLIGRVIEAQNSRTTQLENTLQISERENRAVIDKLAEGQTQLISAVEKLTQHIENFEERHASDLVRIEERHEDNRNRFEIQDKKHTDLALKVDAIKEQIVTEISLIKEHIVVQVERDKNQESRWKAFLTIISGIVITVIGGVVLAFVMAGKSGAV